MNLIYNKLALKNLWIKTKNLNIKTTYILISNLFKLIYQSHSGKTHDLLFQLIVQFLLIYVVVYLIEFQIFILHFAQTLLKLFWFDDQTSWLPCFALDQLEIDVLLWLYRPQHKIAFIFGQFWLIVSQMRVFDKISCFIGWICVRMGFIASLLQYILQTQIYFFLRYEVFHDINFIGMWNILLILFIERVE